MGAMMGSMQRITSMVGHWAVGLLCALASIGVQATPTVTYYHNDLLGSPVVATNASGQVIWRESYRPYGERLTNAPASAANDVWFTSRRQDVDTGLVYMGARYYDPVLGRFMSRDPVGFDDKNLHSFNRYAYANNNPYRYVDPNGRSGVPATTLAGAEVGTMVWSGPGTVIGGVAGFAVGTWGTWKLLNWVFNEGADSNSAPKTPSDKPSLLDPEGEKHVLEGDGPAAGGGHRAGTGKSGKSEFPAEWSDEKILGEVSDVATDPKTEWSRPDSRGFVWGSGKRDGVDIRVVHDTKNGRIVTGYPTNRGRNP